MLLLDKLNRVDELGTFDVVWCNGSMIHAPFRLVREECSLLLEHLPVGGRWVELCYPRSRWLREGRWPFHAWGNHTDGDGTPWAEWYDLDRLLQRLDAARFEPVLYLSSLNRDQFNWFDVLRVG
jgi:hypothetical protein